MKTVLDTLQKISDRFSTLFSAILQKPTSVTQLVGQLFLFIIIIITMLIILGFTGILEDPSVLFNFSGLVQ